jgi:hypothetical protein
MIGWPLDFREAKIIWWLFWWLLVFSKALFSGADARHDVSSR